MSYEYGTPKDGYQAYQDKAWQAFLPFPGWGWETLLPTSERSIQLVRGPYENGIYYRETWYNFRWEKIDG